MRSIDIEQAFAVCRDAADLMVKAASHPEAELTKTERAELLAIAMSILTLIDKPPVTGRPARCSSVI